MPAANMPCSGHASSIGTWEPQLLRGDIRRITAENDRLYDLVMKRKPDVAPWLVSLGFAIGTATSLGIFAISTEIVK